MPGLAADSKETCRLLSLVDQGNRNALNDLLARHRPAQVAFVELHLDVQVRMRIDPSDVVQVAQMEVSRRMDDFLKRRPMPFHLWLRKTTYERLLNLHRDNRRAKRSVEREQPLPDRSSLLLARPLVSGMSTPSKDIESRDFAEKVGQAVGDLSKADREILLMRRVENLPYEEISCLMDIEPSAARKRYGRALIRLQRALTEHGLLEE